eukprot:594401-Heterocapsa_arctica.AAC.1
MPFEQPPASKSSKSFAMRTIAAGVSCRVSLTMMGPTSSSMLLRPSTSRHSYYYYYYYYYY